MCACQGGSEDNDISDTFKKFNSFIFTSRFRGVTVVLISPFFSKMELIYVCQLQDAYVHVWKSEYITSISLSFISQLVSTITNINICFDFFSTAKEDLTAVLGEVAIQQIQNRLAIFSRQKAKEGAIRLASCTATHFDQITLCSY